MDRLRDYVESQARSQASGGEKNTGKRKWWRWPAIGCGGFLGLLFILAMLGSQISQNKADEIIALGKSDKEAQTEKLAEANDSVLNALEKLNPGLAEQERQRREVEQKQLEAAAKEKKLAEVENKYRSALERELNSMRENPTMDDLEDLKEEEFYVAILIAGRAQILADAPENISPDTKKLQQEYIRLLKAFQSDAFPRLRRQAVQKWREKLWANDVKVRVAGSRSDRVTFTAGIFAANRNKQAAHDGVLEVLKLLRFKRDTYEWYRGSESSYWDLEPPSDDVIATIGDDNNWTPVSLAER